MLRRPIFYSIEYLNYVRDTQNLDIKLFHIKENKKQALLPYFIENKILYGLRYSGILTTALDAPFKSYVKNKFIDLCRRKHIVKSVLRHNPFLPTIPLGRIIKKEPIVIVNLKMDIADIHEGFSRGHFKRLGQSQQKALRINESKDYRFLRIFYQIHQEQTSNKGLYSWSHLRKLFTHLHDFLSFVYVADQEKVIAVSLLLESVPDVFMLYGAMREEGYANYAKHLMINYLIENYKEKGYKRLVLGTGIDGRSDDIFRFKKGFSKDECFVKTYETVIK